MPKSLKDILDGKKSSKTVPGSTGTKPGVDYDPKAGDEQKFVKKHATEKHDDRVGNGEDIYQATNVKKVSNKITNKGHDKGEDESVYEDTSKWSKQDHIDYHKGRHERAVASLIRNPKDKGMERTADIEHGARKALSKLGIKVAKPKHPSVFEEKEAEEVKCNETPAGTYCPVHGKKECSKQLREKSVKEDLAVPLLGGDHDHDDHEALEMAKTQLRALANKAMHLVMAMTDDMHIEPWVQAKIAVAKDNVTAVHDYMIYGDHDKPEDEQTSPYDGGIEVPPSSGMVPGTFPSFSADVNTGRNV